MDIKFSIKIESDNTPAKSLMTIKKETGLSLSEIKNRIANSEAIFECDCTDSKGLALIIRLYDTLNDQGVSASLYEGQFPETIDVFKNTLQSHRETAKYVGLDEDEIDY